jgi:hypothetical protein
MKSPAASPTQEVLAGLVDRVTYHNAENRFCVLRAKARGHRDLVTVVRGALLIVLQHYCFLLLSCIASGSRPLSGPYGRGALARGGRGAQESYLDDGSRLPYRGMRRTSAPMPAGGAREPRGCVHRDPGGGQ